MSMVVLIEGRNQNVLQPGFTEKGDTVFSFIMGYSSNIWQTNLQKKKD